MFVFLNMFPLNQPEVAAPQGERTSIGPTCPRPRSESALAACAGMDCWKVRGISWGSEAERGAPDAGAQGQAIPT